MRFRRKLYSLHFEKDFCIKQQTGFVYESDGYYIWSIPPVCMCVVLNPLTIVKVNDHRKSEVKVIVSYY